MTLTPISAPARMDDKIVLVTGAAGGIGRATTLALAEAGATVIATDIADNADFGRNDVIFRRYDVTSRNETDALVADILKDHGRIDGLVLCAGTISHRPLTESTDEEWRAILDVNLMGVVNPVRAIFSVMERQGAGKMVALGSIAAKIGGVASGPSYVAAKSAVHGLMKWVAKAGASKGIYASIIAPGPVETPMWETVTQRAAPSANGNVPLGRFGQPEDIAQAILFLCSPASNWITGTVLDVNGGMLMD
ncbi:3-oxoacyl-[acyl-carrier protein] reductase [Rhodobium orientis]|uniref:Short-chain dehydrogenase n=1 Tax=Rhodobium orientis TaxID=34017 RepID=A0A327JKP7_9HYPH|nr:SDR family oxidoreductase [Rhodobium orientis]MBB4303249.1 3-oxoacyl-[acyl-carrier protein] reductase [Rhodobium orientis]MBK5951651.1 short-chain dehydrogenase [Rhodobium orientis]RAI25873.1 short-chain dehydrogenase [Rhodobium orientis]